MQSLKTMPKLEKARFLSMDLIERMIRVEQNISASFSKYVPFNQTEYYKCLTLQQKKDFNTFLKKKKQQKILLYGLFVGSLILLALFNFDITGNAIAEDIGYKNYDLSNMAFVIILGVTVLVAIVFFISKRNADTRFNKHATIAEDFIRKKSITKK